MKIRNTTKGDLGFTFETVVPAGSEIEIGAEVVKAHRASPVVEGWFAEGKLVEVKPKPMPSPAPTKKDK